MPDSPLPVDDSLEPGSTPDVTPDAPAAPQYVTLEQYQQGQQQLTTLTQTIQALRESMELMAQRGNAPAPAPQPTAEPDPVTLEQALEALQQGDTQTYKRYEAQKEARYVARINQLEQTGMSAFSQLNQRTETASLKHYARYKKEIDGLVDSLQPQLKMQPGVYQWAHDTIVGRHAEELIGEATEAALRQPKQTADQLITAGARNGRNAPPPPTTPTPRDLGGDGAEQAMDFFREFSRGGDENALARRMGYADWADYMDKTKEYR